jgi:hypothetical protein
VQQHLSALQGALFHSLVTYRNTTLFFTGGLLALFIYALIMALTPLYTFLAVYAYRYGLIPASKPIVLVLYAYLVANLLLLLVFLSQELLLNERYCLMVSLIGLLGVPFVLRYAYQCWANELPAKSKISLLRQDFAVNVTPSQTGIFKNRWVFPLMMIFIVGSAAVEIFHIGASKHYIVEAGHWIAQNTPQESRLFVNDPALGYYANRVGMRYPADYNLNDLDAMSYRRLAHTDLSRYDYLAVVVLRRDVLAAQQLVSQLKLTPIASFHSNRGDRIWVIRGQRTEDRRQR